MSKNQVKWIAKGEKFKPGANPNPSEPGDINIKESGKGLQMPHPHGQRFGSAIDAKLAVSYIRLLWDTVDGRRLRNLAEDTKQALRNVDDLFHSFTEEDKKRLDEAYSIVAENAEKAQHWLVKLLDASAAITMDKNLILKTLSQDECQGLRFYLCMKHKPLFEKEQVEDGSVDKLSHGLGDKILTLCTVGVCKDGKDLFYDYPEERAQSRVGSPIPDIEDESLALEYPFVSGLLCSKPFSDPDLTLYPLYKYAKTH